MNAKKILAVALVALLAVASFAPAFAADKENVMLHADYYDAVNITPDKGDYIEVFDELIAIGPNHIAGGVNWRIAKDAVYNLYDADGYDDEEGAYIGMVIYELDAVYTIDSFKIYTIDMAPLGVGVANTIDWLLMGFDILVSTTGEDGSWEVVYSGKDLHGEGEDAGVWQYGEENDESLAHYYIEANFTKAVDAKYIKWAPTAFNNTGDPTGSGARYFNISELQVFGTAAGAAVEDTTVAVEDTTVAVEDTTVAVEDTTVAVEDTTVAVEDTTVAVEDTTVAVEDTTVATEDDTDAPATFDFVIIPAVALAAAAAGAVVLKKKEN